MRNKRIAHTAAAMLLVAFAATASAPNNYATAESSYVRHVTAEAQYGPVLETAIAKTFATTSTSTTTTTTTTSMTTATTTIATQITTTVVTTEPEIFEFSTDLVADVMYDYFAEKGYNDAQIAGIVANAEAESGLQPSRCENGYFGLFQLMSCPYQGEMLAAFDEAGLGKYAQPEYWPYGASNFDTADDMRRFVEITLDYTMNPNDTTWQTELYNAQSPEEAAEIFLVHYERAVGGSDTIQYYAPYVGCNYQAAETRRDFARAWYESFTS